MKTRVLVIEDSPSDFRLLQELLRDARAREVTLTQAQRLQEGIELLDRERYDVALVDLSLPDAEGLESVERVQAKAPYLPIVVLTGRDDSETALRAVREGAQDYLVKGQGDGYLIVRAMRYAAERKRTIEAVRRSEEKFRSLLENALDIITVVDEQGVIRYASPSTERILGYRPEEIEGQPIAGLVSEHDILPALAAYRASTETGAATPPVEVRVRCKDGEWRVIEAMGRPLLDDPVISGIVINSRDVTDRKHAEQRLRDLNQQLRAVIDASPLAIFLLDLEGRVQSWNKAAEAIFGWTEQEVLGERLPIFPPGAEAEFESRLEMAKRGGTLSQAEARRRRKDGALIDVNAWTALLRDDAGQVESIVGMLADITERKRLEEQFRHSQKMEAVGRLAGGVAHDFNNLLTVIAGYTQLAMNRIADQAQACAELRESLAAAEKAASLTKQLLAFSRRQVVEPTIVDLNALVQDMHRMLARVIGEDIELQVRLSPGVSAVRVDRGQIELVLLNLAVNARDAMPNGGVLTIETQNVHLGSQGARNRIMEMTGDCVMLAVSDTGIGIDPDVRSHIFEPFFTTKPEGKGTGLGLSTSYGIIRQHGGDIWVYSEPNIGTTFKVYLPAAPESARTAASRRSAQVDRGGGETILIVEDEPGVAAVMRDALSAKGYEIISASEPSEAITLAREHRGPIHLLLSDLILNTMHGAELSRKLRALRPEMKVLYVSGYTDAVATGHNFLESGAAFLEKPFAPEVLAAKVREVLGRDGWTADK
jgi:two-component system cell cycle sensor histidine kinase/response regulator CckA